MLFVLETGLRKVPITALFGLFLTHFVADVIKMLNQYNYYWSAYLLMALLLQLFDQG